MPDYQRKEIVPGLFVLAAIGVFALYAFRVGRWELLDFLKGQRLQCRAVLPEVKSLVVGAKVVVAGRRVGAVNRLAWSDQPYTAAEIEHLRRRLGELPAGVRVGDHRVAVEVGFELTDPSLRLDPATAQVALMQDGLLGQHCLDLYPGSWTAAATPAPILAAGFTEPLLVQTRLGGGLEVLATAVGDAVASIDALVRQLHDSVLSPANRENLDALLVAAKGAAEEMSQLLAADGDLRGSALRPLQRVLDAAAAAIASVRDGTLPRADRLLDEAHVGASDFRSALASVQQDLAAVLRQIDGAMQDTRPGLADAVQRLRSALWQAEMALRKIRANPALLLFGDAEPDLEARDIDASGTRASGRARIFEQRDERATGR